MIDDSAGRTTCREDRLNEVLLGYVEGAQVGRPPDRRRLIAANPDLRAELEEFFASQDEVARLMVPLKEVNAGAQPGAFGLEMSDDQSAASAEAGKPPLGQLGDFRLLREVGRGGMGVVYEAEQISLRRRVALKILPFASAIDPRQLQRFQNEALAAAHLRHENIVPVYAVGNERGVHYYAMQFIDGRSLADLIDEMRPATEKFTEGVETSPNQRARASTGKINRDPTRQPSKPGGADNLIASISRDRTNDRRRYFDWLAGLGRQAAEALEHAHQAGIVHRDIKPANLLLDPRGQLWVADFGLAQFSSNSSMTVTGEVLGTLRYASPEQALGKRGLLDHRSDIYSLGASLYELMTLRPIFGGRDRQELLRQIAVEEPPAPRSLDRTIPEELETIILKAVAKEPADRYASAQALADDLQSFLEDRPISARRPTLVERTARWARRHRSVVAAGLFGLVLTIAGLSAAVVLAARAYDSERLRASEAEDRFRLARGLADEMIQIANQETSDDPDQQLVRRRMLEVAVDYYQQFINMRSGDPTAQADLKVTQNQVETLLADLAVMRQAQRHMLLREPDVKRELKITEDQHNKLISLFQDITDREAGLEGDWPQRPRIGSKELLVEMKAHETGLARILTESQDARLRQIGYQTRGIHVFQEPEVIAALKLTKEQREDLKELSRREPHGFRDAPGGGRGGPGGGRGGPGSGRGGPGGGRGGPGRGMRPPPDQDRDGSKDGSPSSPPRRGGRPDVEPDWHAVLAILTPEQRERWNELAGPKLTIRFQGMRGRRPGSFDH